MRPFVFALLGTVAALSITAALYTACGPSELAPIDSGLRDLRSADSGSSATVIATTQTLTRCLTLNAGFLYWVDEALPGNQVVRVATSGGTPTPVVSGADDGSCVRVDATSVYYTFEGKIMRAPSAGGQATQMVQGQNFLSPIFLEGTSLYWVTDTFPADMYAGVNGIARYSTTGQGAIEIVYPFVNGAPGGLHVDANNYYVSDLDGMWVASKTPGSRFSIGVSSLHSNAFAVDGALVAMVELAGIGSGNVAVMRTDGQQRVVVSNKLAAGLAIDTSGVYAVQEGKLVRMKLDGTGTTTLSESSPRAIALDTDAVYFSDGASILKVAK